jgi:hypothetical protein
MTDEELFYFHVLKQACCNNKTAKLKALKRYEEHSKKEQ